MNDIEMSELDFPLATMRMLETTNAMLVTMLQNQIEIMKALNIGDTQAVSEKVNRLLQHNLMVVEGDLKSKVPKSVYIKYPMS